MISIQMKNLWLHTEERPRISTIETIVSKFASDRKLKVINSGKKRILPVMEKGLFKFCYKIEGIKCEDVENIFVTIISGSSSFTDYVVFYSENQPTQKDTPLYLIEETKTDDQESRNTGVYQRSSKFVYSSFFYPEVPKIMLYNLKVVQKEEPTLTYVFGTRMLMTLGVEILGKVLQENVYKPFTSIDELINLKNEMPLPHYGIPVRITKTDNEIEISAKLEKSGCLTHDPNIGMTTIIASCLRQLGWTGKIIITQHGLANQKSVGVKNKFVVIANQIGIELEGLKIPKATLAEAYWDTEDSGEKLGTIFTSILCEEFTNSIAIYENHAGCERGYFISAKDGEKEIQYIAIPKYSDREKYKAGDKTYIIYIPDLVIYDRERDIVIDGEGKTYANREKGYEEIENYDFFEEEFIKKHYLKSKIVRTVILYGGKQEKLDNKKTGLLLNENGAVILGKNAPLLFKEALDNLLSLQ
jgi:hypothetical protein